MRAVVLTGHGGLDMLEHRDDVPVPTPAADEVLISVVACGVNNTDVNTRTGWYSRTVTSATGAAVTTSAADGGWGGGVTFPRIQGADPVGRIVQVGTGVPDARIGERVLVDGWLRAPDRALEHARYLGSDVDGGFAEYVVVPSGNAHPVDSDLSDVELASVPCSYATAEHMLHRAGVGAGQWVLVTGASGGVGGALVQLARRRGARVVAVTSAAKIAAVWEWGGPTSCSTGTVRTSTSPSATPPAASTCSPTSSAATGSRRCSRRSAAAATTRRPARSPDRSFHLICARCTFTI